MKRFTMLFLWSLAGFAIGCFVLGMPMLALCKHLLGSSESFWRLATVHPILYAVVVDAAFVALVLGGAFLFLRLASRGRLPGTKTLQQA